MCAKSSKIKIKRFNGFKCVDSGGQNIDGYKVLYMAFAQRPFVTSEGVPTTAF